MSSLTSVELNFLVFRYLQESGFTHAAFTLGYEAGINKSNIDGNMVPPGALIKFVQKGLQYMEMEANLSNSEVDIDEDFSFFQPLDLISKDVKELQDMLRERKRKERDREKERDRSKENDKEVEREHDGDRNRAREKDRHEKHKEREREREKIEREKERDREKIEREKERERERMERETFERERDRLKLEKERDMEREREKEKIEREREKIERERERIEREKSHEKQQLGDADRDMVIDQTDKENAADLEHGRSTGLEPMDIVVTPTSQTSHIPSSDVRILEGHTSEVCACAWSPSASLLASGSGDATARIWSIPEGSFKSGLHTARSINALILKHAKGKSNEKSKDVTTLDWNGDGTLLATGSCDGQARIWTTNGDLISTLSKHKGPIFSLKWNKKGDYLLTGSVDRTAVVWDVKAEEWKQQFEFHSGPTLDVDWRNNVSFATSSTDSMIYLCKIGETKPVKIFAGHQGEVNCVKWDPTGSLLASCSDDSTAKIWSIKQHTFIHDLREHAKEIYTIRWSPTGQGTNNPNKQLTLASASFDSTVKLWDAELGKMLCSLNGHREPVYSLAFSPNGEYIASGSLDRSMHIWSIKEGKIVKTYTGNGGIFEVCWNKEGNKIAACFADNSVCVIDFRM